MSESARLSAPAGPSVAGSSANVPGNCSRGAGVGPWTAGAAPGTCGYAVPSGSPARTGERTAPARLLGEVETDLCQEVADRLGMPAGRSQRPAEDEESTSSARSTSATEL
ncbi:hypothetical protein ACLGI4_22830 [Streptomyces sp. HMX112]|uniref:hypothetical protein n=1 Tax=Streptomyces sp. HMX112 TaxID=3390850 RepID=UPI003A80AC93